MDTPYHHAILKSRALVGDLERHAAAKIRDMIQREYLRLNKLVESLPAGDRAAALKAAVQIGATMDSRLGSALADLVDQTRGLSYATVEGIMQEALDAVVDARHIPDNLLGAIQTPRVNMAGHFLGTGGAERLRTLRRGATILVGRQVTDLLVGGLLTGMGPDTLARGLRRHVQGSEPLQKVFADLATRTGGKWDLRFLTKLEKAEYGDAINQMRYNAERIAFSEIHNARAEAEIAAYIRDPFVKAVRWELSPNRGISPNIPDECDVLATEDFYGLGAGLYPVDAVPAPPHPFDRCERHPVTRPTKDIDKPKPSPPPIRKSRNARIPGGDKLSKARAQRIRDQVGRATQTGLTGRRHIQKALKQGSGLTLPPFKPRKPKAKPAPRPKQPKARPAGHLADEEILAAIHNALGGEKRVKARVGARARRTAILDEIKVLRVEQRTAYDARFKAHSQTANLLGQPGYDAAEARYRKLHAKVKDVDAKIAKLADELAELNAALGPKGIAEDASRMQVKLAQLRGAVAGGRKGTVAGAEFMQGTTASMKAAFETAAKLMEDIIHPRWLDELGKRGTWEVRLAELNRASFDNGDFGINFRPTTHWHTALHEMVHGLEHSNLDTLHKWAVDWLNLRAEGEALVKLMDVSKAGYKPWEVAHLDKHFHEYVGKFYGGSVYDPGSWREGATEALTMGIQFLFEDPWLMLEKDPEHAILIVRWLVLGQGP